MTNALILASGSEIRQVLLRNAGVDFEVHPARIDEDAVRDGMLREAALPRDIADTLAEAKARKAAARFPGVPVLGCDQVLALEGEVFAKPDSREDANRQLRRLRGKTHQLISAAVICEEGIPVWRHVGVVDLTMRQFSDRYLEAYLNRNWPGISGAVGGYKLEEEGVRLFSRVRGDYFCVLGLPLLEILGYLGLRGVIDT